jgi:hypothetical protein
MTATRQRKTRNQRKHEFQKTVCMVAALVLVWILLCTVLVRAWAVEQPVNGYEYMETIGGDFYGDSQN